tara:strand:+ start:4119 stop:5840 length:1722 start_codon:yes stop_codon:yes gene_type:complete
MNKNIKSIQKFLTKNNINFYLITNNDIHINEFPNLLQKDIYNLTGFDCSHGYLLILSKKIIFFTDSRYTLAAKIYFKKKCEIYDISTKNILNYLLSLGTNLKGFVDPKLISVKEIKSLNAKLHKSNIKILPSNKLLFNKNYLPNFHISYPLSLPKYYIPRSYKKNIKWIKSKIKTDGIIIWNNAHVAYLLNIRSFEINNSTKPFAGLFISKKSIKPIIISKNKYLEKINKIKINFELMSEKKFINYINIKKINSIETQFKYCNYDIFISLSKKTEIKDSNIDIDKKISQKTHTEFKNIKICHIQDGLSLTKFILKSKKVNDFKNEYSFVESLYQLRKEGINFFRNSFDYISALDKNGAIVHYKPSIINSNKFFKQSLLLLDSGAHYLEGTTDVTRVLKLNKLKYKKVKTIYTFLLKSLILLENYTFSKGITASDLDGFVRNYLNKYNITYGHGTGHGVGYFNDVHEKYPIISANSKHKILNNNLFSIEPGYYLPNKFGLRIENLYFSKISNQNIKLINVTLVPYDLSLIDWKLVTIKEKKFIKNYHQKIYETFDVYLSKMEKEKFKKILIDKI